MTSNLIALAQAVFFHQGPIPQKGIIGTYFDYSLVLLSFGIAVCASYMALDIVGNLRAEQSNWRKVLWLLAGAFVLGAGMWSIHFIGLLAFISPLSLKYEVYWGFLAFSIAILISLLVLFLLKKENRSIMYIILGGILFGLGLALMHYIGVNGIKHMEIRYLPAQFFLSLAVAIVVSELILMLALKCSSGSIKNKLNLKIISAFVIGAAICLMHYTGMAAALFIPRWDFSANYHVTPTKELAFYTAGIAAAIIAIVLSLSTYKQFMLGALRNERNFLNAILNNLEDGIIACDSKGKITVLNKAMQKMIDLPSEEQRYDNWFHYCKFFRPNSETPLSYEETPLSVAFKGQEISSSEYILSTQKDVKRNVMVDGQPIVSAHQKKIGAVIAIHDFTLRKQMENQLVRQATYDMITDLPNRMLLLDRIEQAIHFAKRSESNVAILFLDLDHFKFINDAMGHAAGDELLVILSKRLQEGIRESDTVARIGGDEFVILLSSIESEDAAYEIAKKILAHISEPFEIGGRKTTITASIGISSFPKNGENPDALLKHADMAMYRVKTHGRNNIKFYSEEMNLRAIKRLELEQYLFDALKNQEFVIYYQPIVDLYSGYIIGFEALLRWQHPTLGLLLPADFISLTEETGLIVPIGEWVLKTACAQNKLWQDQGLTKVRMSVNVSGKQINNSAFLQSVQKVLEETHLEAKYIELELTESSILERPTYSFKILSALKELGINIALDDFGTGYSSLGYLSRLPVDKLKIDSSFVRDIAENSENAAIILAILGMASSLKLKVTAEGTEKPSELAFLRFNRCDEVQGYYFSKPLTADEATQILRDYPKMELNQFPSPEEDLLKK